MAPRISALLIAALLATVACAAPARPAAAPPDPAAAKPAAAAAPEKPAPASLGELRFNFPIPNLNMLPMHIASKRGFDKEEGFTAAFTQVPGTIGVKAMQAGEFEFSLSVGATLAAAVQGAPVRLVVVHVDKPLYYLYGKAEIRGPEDLKGKSIAVDAIGSGLDIAARRYLQQQGVDPASINYIAMSNTAIPGAIIAGSVDAGVVTTPADLQVKKAPNTRQIAFLGDVIPALSSGIGTTEKLIRERPEAVRAAVRAAMKGQNFLVQNREGAIPIMMEYLNLTQEDASQVYDTFVPLFIKDGRISREFQEQMIKDQMEALNPERQPRPEDVFDLKFAEAVS